MDKYGFLIQKTKFFGFMVSIEGIQMNSQKVEIILKWAQPIFFRYIKSFLGFHNFYPQFIRNFLKLAKSLTDSTMEDAHST